VQLIRRLSTTTDLNKSKFPSIMEQLYLQLSSSKSLFGNVPHSRHESSRDLVSRRFTKYGFHSIESGVLGGTFAGSRLSCQENEGISNF
jgi:hypothetical protein